MSSATTATSTSFADEAAQYGITRVTVEQFEYGGYRYTNLNDALAEARRREPKPDAS